MILCSFATILANEADYITYGVVNFNPYPPINWAILNQIIQ